MSILNESAHELKKCAIVVTHSNELAAQAGRALDNGNYLKSGGIRGNMRVAE